MTRKIILGITIFGYIVDTLTAGSKRSGCCWHRPAPSRKLKRSLCVTCFPFCFNP
jgi:hypothetical protein